MRQRLLFKHRVASTYIPRVLVRMALGGASIILVLKPVIKIAQRFRRPR